MARMTSYTAKLYKLCRYAYYKNGHGLLKAITAYLGTSTNVTVWFVAVKAPSNGRRHNWSFPD